MSQLGNMLTVSRLSTTPVRGCRLQHPDQVFLGPDGVADDRRYLILSADGQLFDGTKLGTLVQVRADLQQDPERLTLRFPDGTTLAGEVSLEEPMTITVHSRTFAAQHVVGPWDAALSTYAGRDLRLFRAERQGGQVDRNPVSIVSSASAEELGRHLDPPGIADPRRFRMLIEVAGARPHQEDEWFGHEVRIGETVVRVTRPDVRCVITTQDPDTGLRDIPTLHVIKSYRGLRDGRHLDFGVYADVVRPGTVRVGDRISLGG